MHVSQSPALLISANVVIASQHLACKSDTDCLFDIRVHAQPTEGLPILSNEPLVSEAPAAELAALIKKHGKAEAAVRSVLDGQRAAQLEALKAAAQPLAVAQSLRNLQVG